MASIKVPARIKEILDGMVREILQDLSEAKIGSRRGRRSVTSSCEFSSARRDVCVPQDI